MKYRLPLIFMLLCANPTWADFSRTKMFHHPLYIEQSDPFILDFRGEWPTDCHPGEQKPVISEYTGDSVLIDFETIVEHVTCNDVPTSYRVLVDMSDVVDDVAGDFRVLDVNVRFGESEFTKTLDKQCTLCDPPPPPRDIKPEPGVYEGEGLEKQGILLARQNERMGVYPLVYDESGNSQWLFGGGGIVEDVYFVKLKQLYGGQCLGCQPPDDPPQKEVVGKLTMLMDSEGLIQVKINDGLFIPYYQLEFGYGEFQIDGHSPDQLHPWVTVGVPNLSGRWAFSESDSQSEFTTAPPISVLPLVFDIFPSENAQQQATRKSKVSLPVPQLTPALPSNVGYTLFDIEGGPVAEMLCEYRGEMVCDLKNPDFTDFDYWYEVKMLSLERMIMNNTAEPGEGEGIGTGTVVRID